MSIGGGEEYGRDRAGEGPAHGRDPAGLTTRTRLPDSEGGTAGRQPARPGRSLVTVVGVVVLLIAAIAFANRGGGGGGDDDSASDDTRQGAAVQPTAPTGGEPAKGSDNGVASGFPHTKQGAQSAAANYSVALGGDGMFHKDQRQKIVDTVYAPDVAEKRKKALDKVYTRPGFLKSVGLHGDGAAPKGMTFVSRVNPVGTKSEDYSDSKATVSVWYSSLFGLAGDGSKNPVSESWYTDTYDLEWTKGAWKVVGSKSKEGPAPVGKDQAASSAQKMADAVKGFGGFTYAR